MSRELERDRRKLRQVRQILESLNVPGVESAIVKIRSLEEQIAHELGRSPLSAAERREG